MFSRWVRHELISQARRSQLAPLVKLPSSRELAQLLIQEADRADAAEAKVAELTPDARVWKILASGEGDYSVVDAAKILSRDPSIKLGRDRLFAVLRELRWVYRQQIDHRHRTYQSAIECGRLSELPSSNYHPRTGELILDPPQVRITVKGLHALHRHLGGAGGRMGEQATGRAPGPEPIKRVLMVAVAELHIEAGRSGFDGGRYDRAMFLYARSRNRHRPRRAPPHPAAVCTAGLGLN